MISILGKRRSFLTGGDLRASADCLDEWREHMPQPAESKIPPTLMPHPCQEGYQHLVQSGLVGGKAVLLGWNGEDSDGFLAVRSQKILRDVPRGAPTEVPACPTSYQLSLWGFVDPHFIFPMLRLFNVVRLHSDRPNRPPSPHTIPTRLPFPS